MTVDDPYQMPDIVEKLGKTTLDQVPVSPKDRDKTIKFRFMTMPLGLKGA